MRLAGKTVLITGSSKGIGAGVADRFGKEGADVVVNYNSDPDGANETVKKIEAAGQKALAVQANVGKVEDIERMFAEALAHFGKLDVLINNAGVEKMCEFLDVTEKDYDLQLDVNLKGTFFCTQQFARHCRDAGHPGKVINMSSVHEDLTFPKFAPYCASKGGMRMLTRNWAVELAEFGISVTGIAPGAIITPMNSHLLNDKSRLDPLLEQIPLKRLGKTDDVANLALFLASDEASYVTGSTYFVDGGLTVFYEE